MAYNTFDLNLVVFKNYKSKHQQRPSRELKHCSYTHSKQVACCSNREANQQNVRCGRFIARNAYCSTECRGNQNWRTDQLVNGVNDLIQALHILLSIR